MALIKDQVSFGIFIPLHAFDSFTIVPIIFAFNYFKSFFLIYKLFSYNLMLLTYCKVQCPVSKYDPKVHATYELLHIL